MTRAIAIGLVVFAAVAHAGPSIPIVNTQIELPNEVDRIDATGPALAGDHVRVHIYQQLESGFYTAPVLEVVLRTAKGIASRTPAPARPGIHRAVEVGVAGAGDYALDVLEGARVVASMPLRAVEKRCAGGGHQPAFTRLYTGESSSAPMPGIIDIQEDTGAAINFIHYAFDDDDGAAILEWRQRGKVVVAQQKTLSRGLDNDGAFAAAKTPVALDAMCPLHEVIDTFPLPDEVRASPGAWEVRVYERDAQAYSLKLAFAKKGFGAGPVAVTAIATPKDLAYEAPVDAKKRARAAELRAMVRSTDAVTAHLAHAAVSPGAPFTDAELPISATARPLATRVAPAALISGSLPGVTRDGSVLAFSQEVAYSMYPGHCAPPSGRSLSFVHVPIAASGAESAASVDVTQLDPLRCDVTRTATGLTLVHPDDDLLHVQLKDSKGQIVAELKADGGNGATTCISEKHHLLVMLMHWGVGGDCSVVGTYQPYAVKY